jgi:spore maturation protein CgeB
VKVLIVHPGPAFSVADVYNGVAKGLEQNGCTVARFNLDDRLNFYANAHLEVDGEYRKALTEGGACQLAAKGLEAAIYEMWPDVIVIMSGWFIPPTLWGVLQRRPHKVVYWCTESPYEDDRQASPARYADMVVLNDPSNLSDYRRNVNPRTYYLPHSFDPDVHHPGFIQAPLACDFGWVGTGFPSRIEFFEAVDWSGLDVKLGGHWQQTAPESPLRAFLLHDIDDCMDNTQTANLYRSAKVSANLYRKEHSAGGHADGWAMGPREVELAACGTFFVREPRPEGDEVFPFLPTFTDSDEFGDLVRWYVQHDTARELSAERACEAIADRTFKATAAEMLRLVEGVTKAPTFDDAVLTVSRNPTPQPA